MLRRLGTWLRRSILLDLLVCGIFFLVVWWLLGGSSSVSRTVNGVEYQMNHPDYKKTVEIQVDGEYHPGLISKSRFRGKIQVSAYPNTYNDGSKDGHQLQECKRDDQSGTLLRYFWSEDADTMYNYFLGKLYLTDEDDSFVLLIYDMDESELSTAPKDCAWDAESGRFIVPESVDSYEAAMEYLAQNASIPSSV